MVCNQCCSVNNSVTSADVFFAASFFHSLLIHERFSRWAWHWPLSPGVRMSSWLLQPTGPTLGQVAGWVLALSRCCRLCWAFAAEGQPVNMGPSYWISREALCKMIPLNGFPGPERHVLSCPHQKEDPVREGPSILQVYAENPGRPPQLSPSL